MRKKSLARKSVSSDSSSDFEKPVRRTANKKCKVASGVKAEKRVGKAGKKKREVVGESSRQAERRFKYVNDGINKDLNFVYGGQEVFPCKMAASMDCSAIVILKDKFNANQTALFKDTCFGFLLDLPCIDCIPMLLYTLLLRLVVHSNELELCFGLCGQKVFFRLEDFALITGLKCTGGEDRSSLVFAESRLKEKYFGDHVSVSKKDVYECFVDMRWDSDEDALLLGVLFVIHTFLLGGRSYDKVDDSDFFFVESGKYKDFAWGKEVFKETIKSMQLFYRGNIKKSYVLYGFPLALQVWLYEICGCLRSKYICHCNNIIPRMLNWSIPEKFKSVKARPSFQVWHDIMGLGSNEFELFKLIPSELEIQKLDLSSFFSSEGDRANVQGQMSMAYGEDMHHQQTHDDACMKQLRLISSRQLEIKRSMADLKIFLDEKLETMKRTMEDYVSKIIAAVSRSGGVPSPCTAIVVRDTLGGYGDSFFHNVGGEEQADVEVTGQHPDVQVFSEIPVRRKYRKAAVLKSSFTTKFGSNSGVGRGKKVVVNDIHPLESNVMDAVEDLMVEEVRDWIKVGLSKNKKYKKSEKFMKYPINFGVETVVEKQWFYDLFTVGRFLSTSHINIIFYYLRKKGRYVKSVAVKSFTTTDNFFDQKIQLLFLEQQNVNLDLLSLEDECVRFLVDYICGFRLCCNTDWAGVDDVLFPVNVNGDHWILARFSFSSRCIYVYNSLNSEIRVKEAEYCMRAYSELLPFLLCLSDVYDRRVGSDGKKGYYKGKKMTAPFQVIMLEGLPVQEESDCGVFTVAFAEYFIDGVSISADTFDVKKYRERLTEFLYGYGMRKILEDFDSDNECVQPKHVRAEKQKVVDNVFVV